MADIGPGCGRNGTCQQIAYDATVAISNAFGAQTRYVRLVANSACHFHVYEVGGTATATVADPFLPANWVETIRVQPGQKISAIKAATNGSIVTATAGTLSVTELTS